jgi:cytochrome c-type biogenesis protein CcmH/NrfG
MAARFCTQCGAKLLSDANFCVECGERQPGATTGRSLGSFQFQRWAPLAVVLAVVAVGGGAIVLGRLSPKERPSVPGRDAPATTGDAPGKLPANHPPIAVPEQVKQAIRDMTQKAAAAPDDLDAWKRLAEVQYRAGQLEPDYLSQAADTYRHVLERDPDNLDVIRALGNIAFDQQRPDAAIDFYQRYLKQQPGDLEVQTDLGTMYLASGKLEQAIQQYENVLKTNPSFFQAQFNLAIAYRSMGDPDKAMAALEKSRGMAPDDKARAQVDQLLAHVKGQPPLGQASGQASTVPTGSFQADAEELFRQNAVIGPKVQRIEWVGADAAKVYLREFPVDQMEPDMRSMFVERMKSRIKDRKDAHKVAAAMRFELVDDATGKMIETITE